MFTTTVIYYWSQWTDADIPTIYFRSHWTGEEVKDWIFAPQNVPAKNFRLHFQLRSPAWHWVNIKQFPLPFWTIPPRKKLCNCCTSSSVLLAKKWNKQIWQTLCDRLHTASTFSSSRFLLFFFLPAFVGFGGQILLLWTVYALFTHCAYTVHVLKNIKNGSHDTIYTFKNYFATVFSVFSFQQQ